jgi:sterol desaturase/sphingolipid hydroxylase (fatty acid hydroxylase superfamily)
MIPPRVAAALSALGEVAHQAGQAFMRVFLEPGSHFSIASLAVALAIGAGVLALQRVRRGRRVRLKVLVRALFPRRLIVGPSTKADLGFFLFNLLLFGGLAGWAILTYGAVSRAVIAALDATFGIAQAASLPAWACTGLATVALFLAYELAYWVDHWLSHKVPALWEFHKVHHTAEGLTPLTNFRVHPVDSVVFGNITALFMGLTAGVLGHVLGRPVSPFTVSGGNIILLGFIFLTVHLQHSHIWIAFTGVWGRIFVSPAHHQLHHSADPAHFDRNFGSCLALWDWMFGTLNMPSRERQAITFGAPAERPHSITGGLITPFVEALARLKPAPRRTAPDLLATSPQP